VSGSLGTVVPVPIAALRTLGGGGSDPEALVGIAEAIAGSPPWTSLDRALLVVRSEPEPVLGVLTTTDDAADVRLEALAAQLGRVAEHGVRYVGYEDAGTACRRLAERLHDRFGPAWLDRAHVAAIPRGGHVVLGLLAYALGLRSAQLAGMPPEDRPLVLVDDVALSGARLRSFLRDLPGSQPVVVAHLCSTPQLREAIEAAEPRVLACVAADDLRDLAPQLHGDAYAAWRQRWATRNPSDYWTGDPEPVCFAWNEPDLGIWNPVTDQVEPGWRLVPPGRCLKNATASPDVTVQVCEHADGPLRPAPAVVWGRRDAEVAVAGAHGPAVALDGVAADIWLAIAATGDLEAATTSLLDRYDVARDRLAADVAAFADHLIAAGLLEERSRVDPGPGTVTSRIPVAQAPTQG
jgi:hypothetical protein